MLLKLSIIYNRGGGGGALVDIFKLFGLMIKAFMIRGQKASKISLVYFQIFERGPINQMEIPSN